MSEKTVQEQSDEMLAKPDACDVCKNEPGVGVAAVPGVPMSICYGRKCLEAGAQPMWILVSNTACVAPSLEETAEWWQEMVQYSLDYFGVSREEFNKMVRRDAEDMDAHMREMQRQEEESGRSLKSHEPPAGEPF